jgi:hypothetical protein
MKKLMLIAVTLVTLTSATNSHNEKKPSKLLQDNGGPEPPCPTYICADPKLH